jgi:hypothetical protein
VDPREGLLFSGGPPGSVLDPVTGEFEWVPQQSDADGSPLLVNFTVMDAYGSGDLIFVRFHVEDVVMRPLLQLIGLVEGQKVSTESRINLRARSIDETGGPWADTYKWYQGEKLIGLGPEIAWTPSEFGITKLTVVASNRDGVEARLSVNVSVKSGPCGPDHDLTWVCLTTGAMVLIIAIAVVYRVMTSGKVWKGRRGPR